MEENQPDLLRAMLKSFAEVLMSAEAPMQCGAAYGGRTNQRNGFRTGRWGTRAGTMTTSPSRSSGGALTTQSSS